MSEKQEEVTPREKYALLARLAEHAERYDEMAEYMREVVLHMHDLTMEERNLLSVAYKNVIGTRRASWRLVVTLLNDLQEKMATAESVVANAADKEKVEVEKAGKETEDDVEIAEVDKLESEKLGSKVAAEDVAAAKRQIEIVRPFKQKIEKELLDISHTVLDLLTKHLIPNSQDVEVKVFYYKMVGDYYRYISEFSERDERKKSASSAYDNYVQATEIARSSLSPTHPLRLGLALNFSVFYYEVLNSANRACLLAKQAFDDAIPELDTLPDELYHDSKLIMKLLRDNLTFWQSEANVVVVSQEKDSDREVSPTSPAR